MRAHVPIVNIDRMVLSTRKDKEGTWWTYQRLLGNLLMWTTS